MNIPGYIFASIVLIKILKSFFDGIDDVDKPINEGVKISKKTQLKYISNGGELTVGHKDEGLVDLEICHIIATPCCQPASDLSTRQATMATRMESSQVDLHLQYQFGFVPFLLPV